jgi:fibronectin type 3 domain-containing protein
MMSDTVTTWTLLQEFTDQKTTIWVDKNLQPGQTYSYTLVAVDSSKLESDPSIPLTVAVPEKRMKDAVKKVDVEVDRQNRSITINWIKVAEDKNIRLFELYRAQDKQQMSLYKQVPAATNSFIDTDLQVNTRYKYAVRAVYTDGKYSDFVIKQVIY